MGEESSLKMRVEPYLRTGFHFREDFAHYAAETGVAVTVHLKNAAFSLAPNFSMAGDVKRAGLCGLGTAKLWLSLTAGLCGDFNLEDHSVEPKLVSGLLFTPGPGAENNASIGLFFAVHDLTDVRADGATVSVGVSGRL